MFLVSPCSCLCPIHWSQVSSWEWRCSWSSADRRCSNHIRVINNYIAYYGAAYIRSFTVCYDIFHNPDKWRNLASLLRQTNAATSFDVIMTLLLSIVSTGNMYLRFRLSFKFRTVSQFPTGTRRNNVIMTSKRCRDVVSTSWWRYYCVVVRWVLFRQFVICHLNDINAGRLW